MDIGLGLRQARQARALSLDDISQATKISPTLLKAIENDAFDRIPPGLFTRGYLRAYARAVGVEPEGVVERYRESFLAQPVESEPEQESVADSDAPVTESKHTEILQIAVIAIVAIAYLAAQRPSRSTAQSSAAPV